VRDAGKGDRAGRHAQFFDGPRAASYAELMAEQVAESGKKKKNGARPAATTDIRRAARL